MDQMVIVQLKCLLTILSFSILLGCVAVPLELPVSTSEIIYEPLEEIAPPERKVPIAVYTFTDKTGQRKPSQNMALISTAVTQGAEIWLIQALKRASRGEWFTVVERTALDNLLKERQIIRQTRETSGDKDNLGPLLFAGVLLEGGIVGYDTNTFTGGSGARALGVGLNTEIRKDTVTIGIRLISVVSGEILLAISSQKTILSTQISGDIFKFIDMGTKLIEVETGYTENESVTYAVRKAIEHSVLQIIKQGAKQNLWKIKERFGPPKPPCDYELPEVLQRDTC
jgi:curli production assembly/transport component CsgG